MRQNRIQRRRAPTLALLPALLLSPLLASAAIINESENNDTFATADVVPGGTHTINGSIGDFSDVDIYRFSNLSIGNFNATITNKVETFGAFDISTVVFDDTGHSWWGNDGTDSAISFSITQPGTYFLAVSAYQNEAVDMFGNFLREDFWWSEVGLTGTTFAGWSDQAFGYGEYTLSVNSVSAVPVPAAAWLLGSGLAGLVGVARRKSIAA